MRDFNLTYIDIFFLGVPESINLLHNNKAFERMSPFVIVILVMLTTKTLIVVHATIIVQTLYPDSKNSKTFKNWRKILLWNHLLKKKISLSLTF